MGIFDKFKKNDSGKSAFGTVKPVGPEYSDVISGSSSSAPATPASSFGGRTYIVVKGDSLSKIAKREYGDAMQWTRIYEANRESIKDPNLIYPGQTLRLP
jgi:nucleoid-associated protein YgaU